MGVMINSVKYFCEIKKEKNANSHLPQIIS